MANDVPDDHALDIAVVAKELFQCSLKLYRKVEEKGREVANAHFLNSSLDDHCSKCEDKEEKANNLHRLLWLTSSV
eukprot:14884409-Ditylum_brightwellii.AAC.1